MKNYCQQYVGYAPFRNSITDEKSMMPLRASFTKESQIASQLNLGYF